MHPESIVHAVVQLNDGASLAHLGLPDMRVPISYALHFPERADVPVPALDLAAAGSLTFEEPDLETFRCLALARDAALAGGTAPCVLNAANEVAVHAFLAGRLALPRHRARDPGRARGRGAHAGDRLRGLYEADAHAREHAAGLVERLAVELEPRGARLPELRLPYVLAALGFAVLIILHELGHFTMAKRVGMRVERFLLFFPPILTKVKRGETEYGIGAIPLGGYVKITGMNPEEKLPPEIAHRGVLPPAGVEADRGDRRPGPLVNIVLAFVMLFFLAFGAREVTRNVEEVSAGSPAAQVLRPATGSCPSTAAEATRWLCRAGSRPTTAPAARSRLPRTYAGAC